MKRVITTLVIGEEASQMSEISLPLMRKYADFTKSDLVILGETELSKKLNPFYEKMQIHNLLEEYDQVQFIDIDILITPDAKNIFDQVSWNEFAAVSVQDVFSAIDTQKQLLAKLLGPIDWTKQYFNSGVFIASKKHRHLFNIDDGLIEKWISGIKELNVKALNDQNILNYRVNQSNTPITYLNNEFNFTRAWNSFNCRFTKSCIHYAGFRGDRVNRMSRDRDILTSKLYDLYRNHSGFVTIADKMWDILH